MHITIAPKTFYEIDSAIDEKIDVQNLSEYEINYIGSDGQPTLTGGYLTEGFILKPLDIFRVERKDLRKCWLYNAGHADVKVEIFEVLI